jgi:hypothetical protein
MTKILLFGREDRIQMNLVMLNFLPLVSAKE